MGRSDMKVLRILTSVLISTICVTAYSIDHSFSVRGGVIRRRSQVCMTMSASKKSIYGIAHSGWKSPKWNWGSAIGTGHDCAKICRQNSANRLLRQELISNLINAQGNEEDLPSDFEEVKLTLALAWQRGRWDGSDGGKGGYGDVLESLVMADRYENGPEPQWSKLWIRDLASRFHLLKPSADNASIMENLLHESSLSNEDEYGNNFVVYRARRRCSGLVLLEMGFINNGC
jgi:hypothetical protein